MLLRCQLRYGPPGHQVQHCPHMLLFRSWLLLRNHELHPLQFEALPHMLHLGVT